MALQGLNATWLLLLFTQRNKICNDFCELAAWSMFYCSHCSSASHYCHNGQGGVSNHQSHNCLLKLLFRCRLKKTSELCVTGLCARNSLGTGEFPAQMVSNTENVSIWWYHHEMPSNFGFVITWPGYICSPYHSYVILHSIHLLINSSPPNAAYMYRWIGSALVQIMACHLFGAKPLSESALTLSIGP